MVVHSRAVRPRTDDRRSSHDDEEAQQSQGERRSAFRKMARAAGAREAYARTVWFYRSGGQEWARQLRVGSGALGAAG
jgi:hypothetical protein